MSAGSLGMKWRQRAIPSPWLSITRWTQLPGVQQHSRHVLALLDEIVPPPLSLSLSLLFLLCVSVGVAHLTSPLQNNVNKLQDSGTAAHALCLTKANACWKHKPSWTAKGCRLSVTYEPPSSEGTCICICSML